MRVGYGAVNGPTQLNITAVSANYTVTANDEYVQVTTGSGGDVQIKLPAPTADVTEAQAQANPVLGMTTGSNAGQTVRIEKVDTGTSHVVVDGLKPQYIRAAGKVTLNSNGSSATFMSDGSFWNVLGAVS